MTQLAWGNKVSEAFRNKVFEGCTNYNWTRDHADWIMSCMAFESGETFSPSVKNAAGSGATGLIQFMPGTALDLGTNVAELARMGAEEQLDVVFEYFHPYYRKISSLSDMYMAILLPKYIGKPDSAVLFSGGVAYRQNSGLDVDKDGNVTKMEAAGKVYAKLKKGLKEPYVWSE